jgi:hypothetical protein
MNVFGELILSLFIYGMITGAIIISLIITIGCFIVKLWEEKNGKH